MVRHGLLVAGAVAFCVLVLLNVGGYRYGVSDQAFYIPVVRQGLEPGLYPHDASLLAAQNRFFAFDNWFAPLVGLTGSAVPHAFLLVYLAGLLALYIAAVGVGRGLFKTWWAVAGFLVGLTLRHRIPDTAVNTMEAYFHPRLLAFAVGLAAVAIFLRGRTWPALLVAAAALLIHPTTALWFALWVDVAALVADR